MHVHVLSHSMLSVKIRTYVCELTLHVIVTVAILFNVKATGEKHAGAMHHKLGEMLNTHVHIFQLYYNKLTLDS